ncbi:MAG: hypothetical protein ACTSPB_11780, partial [Candidatus Thorarchaeota archaeon]
EPLVPDTAGISCVEPIVSCYSFSKIGDVNNDNEINQEDVNLIQNIIDGSLPLPENTCCIDANLDNVTDESDKTLVQNFITGSGDTGFVNYTCSNLVCEDGTRHYENPSQPQLSCSEENKGMYCDWNYSSNEAVLIYKCVICGGCPEGYGCVNETCLPCDELVEPPVMTPGEENCEATGGSLVTLNDTEYGCPYDYECECPDGMYYDENTGCVEYCNNNGICEPWESKSNCESDCPVEFTSLRVDEINEPPGLRFSGEIDLTILNEFVICPSDVDPQICLEAYESGCQSNCICGNTNPFCAFSCHDSSGSYYAIAKGVYGQLPGKNVIISSNYQNYTCPQLGLIDLDWHRGNIEAIYNSSSIQFEKAVYCIKEPRSSECSYSPDINETIDYWENKRDMYREIMIICANTIPYLEDVISNPTIERVEEARVVLNQTYAELNRIYGGTYTAVKISNVDVTDRANLNTNATITASISLTGETGGSRYGQLICTVKKPSDEIVELIGNCSELENGVEKIISFNLTEQGNWTVVECSINVSFNPRCEQSMTYDTYFVNKTVEAVPPPPNVQVEDVSVSDAYEINSESLIKVKLNPGNTLRHGKVYCKLTKPSDELSIESDCLYIDDEIYYNISFTPDELGDWSVDYCYVEATLNDDCTNMKFHDNYTEAKEFEVIEKPEDMYISVVNIPSPITYGTVGEIQITATNPSPVQRYAFAECDFERPDSVVITNSSVETCKLVDSETVELHVRVFAGQAGEWSVKKCRLKVSSLSDCSAPAIHNETKDLGSFLVPDLAITGFSVPDSLEYGETANVKVTVKNFGDESHDAEIKCVFIDPDGITYELSSDKKKLDPGDEETFELTKENVQKSGVWNFSCSLWMYSEPVQAGGVTGSFDVKPSNYCESDDECPGTDDLCYCSDNLCQACPETHYCWDHQCYERKTIEFIHPKEGETLKGIVIIQAAVNGSGIVSAKYAYNEFSSGCIGSVWNNLIYNPVSGYYESDAWDTTELDDGTYYLCGKVSYSNGTEAFTSINFKVSNYDFQFDCDYDNAMTNPGNHTDYRCTLKNTGYYQDTYTFTKFVNPADWSADLLINNQSANTVQLDADESANIILRVYVPSSASIDDIGTVNLTIKNSQDKKESFKFTTSVHVRANHPPIISNVSHAPDPVKTGYGITFTANVRDEDDDRIKHVYVCRDVVNDSCLDEYCEMQLSQGVYTCYYTANLQPGDYNYKVFAIDERNANSSSSMKTFTVVSQDYCESSAECGAGKVCINHRCELTGCRSNSDCPSDKPICDTLTRTCVQCLQNSDCAGNDNSCYCENKQCKPCSSDETCMNYECLTKGDGNDNDNDGRIDEDPLDGIDNDNDGFIDEDGAGIDQVSPVLGCVSDSDCPSGRCKISTGECVECLIDEDCPTGEKCANNACVQAGGEGNIIYIIIILIIVIIAGTIYFIIRKGEEEKISKRLEREIGF